MTDQFLFGLSCVILCDISRDYGQIENCETAKRRCYESYLERANQEGQQGVCRGTEEKDFGTAAHEGRKKRS